MEHMYEPLECNGRFLWHNRDNPMTPRGDFADYLPECVFRNLHGYMVNDIGIKSRVKAYASKQSAMDALADALQRSE